MKSTTENGAGVRKKRVDCQTPVGKKATGSGNVLTMYDHLESLTLIIKFKNKFSFLYF